MPSTAASLADFRHAFLAQKHRDADRDPLGGIRPDSPANDPEFLHVGGFGSYYGPGANFGFADGSVRYISNSVDARVYRFLGHRGDGELLEEGPW
ncbi:MAG: H-X9-DG-CTERM domain-containing protein [Isosphaeraceae bacterium]